MQYICGVAVEYCVSVSVHVFVYGAKKQPKKEIEDNNSTCRGKMIGVPINEFKPTPFCL